MRARSARRPELLACGLLAALCLAGAVSLPLLAEAELVSEPAVLGLVLNGTLLADSLLVHQEAQADGRSRFWLPVKEVVDWRIDTSGRPGRDINGVAHAAFCGALDRCIHDDSSALLILDLPAAELLSLRFSSTPPAGSLQAAASAGGAYLNYEVAAWHNGRPGAAAFVEGRLTSSLGHGAMRVAAVAGTGQPTLTLTQGVWQVDLPARGISLQAGSIATPDSAFGAGMPLTGLHVGSNNLLDPTRSNKLQPRIEGLAERSLRADVFVDGMFRQTSQVPYGPFSVELSPHYVGRGDIELLSTDINGKQVRVSLPYYQAPQMLAPGALEWSLDAGQAADSSPPGTTQTTSVPHRTKPWMVGASLRRGMNRSLTLQAQALAARAASRLALAADIVQPRFGLSSLSAVWQPTPASARPQWWLGAGHEYSSRLVTLGLKLEQALDAGARSGSTASVLQERMARPARHLSSQLGATLAGRWSMALALDKQTDSAGRRSLAAALNLRYQAGARSQLGLSLQRLSADGVAGNSVLLTWTQPLGRQYAGQLGLQRQNHHDPSLLWSVQQVPATEAGNHNGELQLSGALGADNKIGARWNQHSPQGDWRLEGRASRQGTMAMLGATGSLGLVAGHAFASRRINDAFVLVDAGLPDLPVLLDNREVARTNGSGLAVVAEARAHQPNLIGIDISSLPIRYAIPQDQQSIVPALASGVVARFDVSDGGVAIEVRDAQGRRLPAGAAVTISTQRLPTAVTSRSEIFLERSDREAQVSIELGRLRCSFRYRPNEDPDGGYRCAAP